VYQRTVDDVRVAGDPPDVRHAGVDLSVVVVEHVLVRNSGEEVVTASHELEMRELQREAMWTRTTRKVAEK
jgi:hypothetical protein